MISKLQNQITGIWSFLCKRENLHYLITAIAVVTLFPALEIAKFPGKWNWLDYFGAYTILALQSVMVAAVLYFIQSPNKIRSIISCLWNDKPKLLITLMFAGVLVITIGPKLASIALIDTIAFIELLTKFKQKGNSAYDIMMRLFPSAVYLFFGLIIIFTFVNIVVRIRYYGLYDNFLNNLDKNILGMSVLELARYASDILPKNTFHVLNFIYYGMFAQIGAALIICGVSSGSRQALQFVGTILFAYYIAIILFFLLPSIGPFYFHGPDFDRFFNDIPSHTTQKYLFNNAQYLWEQKPVKTIPVGYYIGFPCMHIAQPLIVLWYLRKWKNMAAVLLTYDILLVVAILLLEWHFFVDILGGVAVAAVAVLTIQAKTASSYTQKVLEV